MNFHSFRNALGGLFLALAGALLLSACGGGGAASGSQGSALRISPEAGTIYAGVPVTFSVVGGRAPYTLTSTEPSLLPVPQTLNGNSFTVIPANPGVVDTGGQPGELPRRTVTITVRESTGLVATATIAVGQNFLTGYGLSLTPTNCPGGSAATPSTACGGGTTAIRLQAVFAGNLHGNEAFRLEVIRGNYSLRNPVTNQAGSSVTVTSDHTGTVTALIDVGPNVVRQVAVIRTVHVATGVYSDQVFIIDGVSLPGTEALTAIPEDFTFTGATSAECGTGFGDFLVFGGVPPFTAVSTNPTVFVTPTQSSTNPGRFTIAASNPTICVTDATVVVTDALGQRATVTVTTEAGSTAPPAPTPIAIAPNSITLACGTSGSISVVGGRGPLSVTSTHPRVSAIVSGNTITVTRPIGDGATVYPTAATISVTDGSQIATATATVPANCP